MGLDMYLVGEKSTYSRNEVREDGYRLIKRSLELGYWRKHPNLHGYIVETFAEGKDECQEIPLTAENLEQIISAVERDRLIPTEGFFFGFSDGSEKPEDLAILRAALKWLTEQRDGEWRDVHYRASW